MDFGCFIRVESVASRMADLPVPQLTARYLPSMNGCEI